MVATDQGKEVSGLAGLFKMMDEEDKKRFANLGQAASNFAMQPMGGQMAPVQFGGGLLQMMPAPEMQMGQGMMGFQPVGGGSSVESTAEFIDKMRKMLGLPV